MKKGVVILIAVVGILLVGLGVYFSFEKKEVPKNIYVVQFNTNGGSSIESQLVDDGGYAKRPTNPIKIGYIFNFWEYNGVKYEFDIKVTNDITLNAVWEEVDKNQKKYIVSFDTSGGERLGNIEVLENSSIVSLPIPKRNGYTFKNWQLNGKVFDNSTLINSNITLVAVWEEQANVQETEKEPGKVQDEKQEKFIVSFNSNGGTSISDIEVKGKSSVITLPIPMKKGYVFKNWQLGNKKFYNSILVDRNMTLVAIWEKIDNENSSSSGDNIIDENNKPDDNIDSDLPEDKPISVAKHVRLVDDLKIEVHADTVKFSKYLIDFTKAYDKNYYYSSVDGYEFLKSSTIDGSYKIIGNTTFSTFEVKNADVSKDYYYAVRAYKKIDGKTEYSEEMKIVYVPMQLLAPSNVFYTADQNKINVTFDVNDANVQKYQILKKVGTTKTIVASSTAPEASWSDSDSACYTVRGYTEFGSDVKLYGLESKEVCFKPILESVKNIIISPADPATGFDYKITWDTLANRPNSYFLDVYRKDANGNQLDYMEEYIFSNTYFACGFDNGEYVEIYVHGYDKTVSYELKGPPSTFYIR